MEPNKGHGGNDGKYSWTQQYPVQVVRLDKKSNGLELNIDALAEICLNEKCRDRPLCVVSIAGDFRKGKSFMLNFFLRYLYHVSAKQAQRSQEPEDPEKSKPFYEESLDEGWLGDASRELEGFSWRGGRKPETTGILIWSDPIVITRPDGKEVAVLLMDTQGAFDPGQTIGQTATIFALSTLISSLQIYNLMNNIQEDNLNVLDMFLGYGQLALDKSAEKPFQELCFLVRDWRFPKDFDFGSEGGAAFLKEKLELLDEDPESPDNKTRLRIENCFEKKTCFLMPYPGEQVSTGEEQFKGQISEMNPNFVDHLRVFVPQILSPKNLLVKKVGGSQVNGQSLLEYFKVYAETFKGGEMPEAKNLYDATAEASNLAAVSNSKNFYLKSMKGICGTNKPYVNPKILEQKHNQLLKESLKMFESTKKLGGEDYSKNYCDDLMKEIANSFDEFVEMNNSKNMFNMWGSPLILLCFWFIAFTLSRIFELIGIGFLANLLYLQATICFISIIAYLSLK